MKNKGNQKHLTLEQRIDIEKGLTENKSFAEIGRIIGKDPSTISKGAADQAPLTECEQMCEKCRIVSNELPAREGIDTHLQDKFLPNIQQCRNKLPAREGIDTLPSIRFFG